MSERFPPARCEECGAELYSNTHRGTLLSFLCDKECQCDDYGNWHWHGPTANCLKAENKALREAIPEPKRLCEIADWIEQVPRPHSDIVAVYDLRVWADRIETTTMGDVK